MTSVPSSFEERKTSTVVCVLKKVLGYCVLGRESTDRRGDYLGVTFTPGARNPGLRHGYGGRDRVTDDDDTCDCVECSIIVDLS